jgi:hypothetical protein
MPWDTILLALIVIAVLAAGRRASECAARLAAIEDRLTRWDAIILRIDQGVNRDVTISDVHRLLAALYDRLGKLTNDEPFPP